MKTAGKLLAASFELFLLSHDKRKAFRLVDLKKKEEYSDTKVYTPIGFCQMLGRNVAYYKSRL